jgi:DNA repair protein RecN (Recombination protein N)
MLEMLRIQNYALIDDLEIDFREGFNVLTGETGAGKSIIIGALNLVLGARAAGEVVRGDAGSAKIDAIFRVPKPSRRLAALLKQHDIVAEDAELMLSRVITAEGRSRAYAGGSLAPISVLAALGDELVDLHGQHEHQSLLKPDRQLDLVDAFAGTETLAGDVAAMVTRLRDLEKVVAELESDDRERARRMEFLRHEVHEINAADLQPREEETLKARRNLIANAEKIFALASHARTSLYEGEEASAIAGLDGALSDLNELAQIDDQFRRLRDLLSGVRAEVEEAAADLRVFTERIEFNPDELDRVNERLVVIGDLRRKYGGSIESILEYRDRSMAQIDAYDSRDQRLAELHGQRTDLRGKVQATAVALSQKRKAAARKLDKQITAALQELGMKGGRFETDVEPAGLALTGIDHAEFLLAANPGEKIKPLRQVASGGEIGRIMLALKAVFAEADKIPTLVFDEIDAGVGGHIARNVAGKLRGLAESHQVICITHIAQIAAAARRHYNVAKSTQGGRSVTSVVRVEDTARAEEIARLLDGSVSAVSMKHARALLNEA